MCLKGLVLHSGSAFPQKAGKEPGPCPEGLFPAELDGTVPAAHPAEQPRPPLPAESLAPPVGFSSFPACFPSGKSRLVTRCLPGPRGRERGSPGPPRRQVPGPGGQATEPRGPGPAESCQGITPAGGREFPFLLSKVNSQAFSLPPPPALKGPAGRKGERGKKKTPKNDGKERGAEESLLGGKLSALKANVTPRRAGAPSTAAPGRGERQPHAGVPRFCPGPPRSLAGLERGEQRGGALSPRELAAGRGVSPPSPSEPLCLLPGGEGTPVSPAPGAHTHKVRCLCRAVDPCPKLR